MPFRRALAEAQKLGAAGIELDAAGEFAPQKLSQTGRRELRHLLRSHDLELTALTCPLRHGLDVAENQEARIDLVKQVMSLSFDLGPRLTVVHAGQIPEKEEGAPLLQEALSTLAQHGDRVGAILALETGLASGATLNGYVARFDTGSLGVSLNPGSLLVHQHNPYESARAMRERVVYAHATDARNASRSVVSLGQGDIDWLQLLGVLEEIEYRQWLVIDKEPGQDSLRDVSAGLAFLRRLIGVAS